MLYLLRHSWRLLRSYHERIISSCNKHRYEGCSAMLAFLAVAAAKVLVSFNLTGCMRVGVPGFPNVLLDIFLECNMCNCYQSIQFVPTPIRLLDKIIHLVRVLSCGVPGRRPSWSSTLLVSLICYACSLFASFFAVLFMQGFI